MTAHEGQGPEDDSKVTGEHVRVHESGHAIVGHSVGLVVDHVIGKLNGHVSAFPPVELNEYARTVALVAYYAAGNTAEEVILGAACADHGEDDRAEIEKLREAHPEWSNDIEKAVAKAKELVEANRQLIENLAKRLQGVPPTVQGADLAKFLDQVEQLPPCDSPPS